MSTARLLCLVAVCIAAGVAFGGGCSSPSHDDGATNPPKGWSDPRWQATVVSMLPEEWQDVKKIPMAMTYVRSDSDLGNDAGQDPWADLKSKLHLAIREGAGYASYVDVSGCGDPYEAYTDRSGDTYRVLLSHAVVGFNACGGALYTYHFALGAANAATKVNLYLQQELGGKITMLASAQAETATADCVGLTPCGVDNPCANENGKQPEAKMPFNEPEQTVSCMRLDACGGAACAYSHEGCIMQCGKDSCAVLESYPLQLSCK